MRTRSGFTDEPFMATVKKLQQMLRDKQDDLLSGNWESEIAARVLVAETKQIETILDEMKAITNRDFGEEEID